MSVASRGSAASSATSVRRRPPPLPTDEINACDHEREMVMRTSSTGNGSTSRMSISGRSFVDQSRRTLLAPDLPAAPPAAAPSPPFPTSGRRMTSTSSEQLHASRRRGGNGRKPQSASASSVGSCSSSTGTPRRNNAKMLPPSSAAANSKASSSKGGGSSSYTSSKKKKAKARGGKRKNKAGENDNNSRDGSSQRSETTRRSRSSAASSDHSTVVEGHRSRHGERRARKKSLFRVKLTLLSLDGIVVASNNANANANANAGNNKENRGGGGGGSQQGGTSSQGGNNTFGKRKPYRNDYWNNAARRPPPPLTAVASVVCSGRGTQPRTIWPPAETHLPSRSMNLPRPTPARPSVTATAVWDADARAGTTSSSSVSGTSVRTDDSTEAPATKPGGTSVVLERLVDREAVPPPSPAAADAGSSSASSTASTANSGQRREREQDVDNREEDEDGLVEVKLSLLQVGGKHLGNGSDELLPLGLISFALSGREREETELDLPVDLVTRHNLERFANLRGGAGGGKTKKGGGGGMFGLKKKKKGQRWGSLVQNGGEDGGGMSFSFPNDPSGRCYGVEEGATLRVRVEVTSGDRGKRVGSHRAAEREAASLASVEEKPRDAAPEDQVPRKEGAKPPEATVMGNTSSIAENVVRPESFRAEKGSKIDDASVDGSASPPSEETEKPESSPTPSKRNRHRQDKNDSVRAPMGSPLREGQCIPAEDYAVLEKDLIESIIERSKRSAQAQHHNSDDDDSLLNSTVAGGVNSTVDGGVNSTVDRGGDYCVEVQTDGIEVETITSGMQFVKYAPVTPSPEKEVRKLLPTVPNGTPASREERQVKEERKASPRKKRGVSFDPEVEVPRVEIWKEEENNPLSEDESVRPEPSMMDRFLDNVRGHDPLVKTVLRQASTLDRMLESMEKKLWAGDGGGGDDEATEVSPRRVGDGESTERSSSRRNIYRSDSGYSMDSSYRYHRDDDDSTSDDDYSCASSITCSSDIPDGKSIGSLSLLEVAAAKKRLHRYARRTGVDVQDLV